MRSCKEIAKLLSPGERLTFFQKMETKMHLFMCKACRKFQKQLKLLSFAQKEHISKKMVNSEGQIRDLEQKIIEKITKTGS